MFFFRFYGFTNYLKKKVLQVSYSDASFVLLFLNVSLVYLILISSHESSSSSLNSPDLLDES